MPHRALAYARQHRARFVDELKSFARFPTVSSQTAHTRDLKECALWLARHMRKIGMQRVKVAPTEQHPVVYAEWQKSQGAPTILIYGHYDVVPPEPLAEWRTPPFEPVIVGEDVHGRGVCDDKGQMFVHVKALESYLSGAGRLPVNVKCL